MESSVAPQGELGDRQLATQRSRRLSVVPRSTVENQPRAHIVRPVESHQLKQKGFTLVELLSVLAIVAVLIAILLPVVASSRRRAQEVDCLSNVRQWSSSVTAYAQDYDGNYPAAITSVFVRWRAGNGGVLWYDVVRPYAKTVLTCPSRGVSEKQKYHEYASGYALNTELNIDHTNAATKYYTGNSETVQQYPSTVVTVFDARPGIIALGVPDFFDPPGGIFPRSMRDEISGLKPAAYRHDGGANYAFADGHAKWLRPTNFVINCDGTHPCFKP